jgi:hypothetical protein
MAFADPEVRAAGRRAGFVGLAIPATGRLSLRQVALAPGYADFTPQDGPRLGWPQPVKWVGTLQGQTVVWCGERRGVAGLPENLAAFTVTARLGCAGLADRIGLRGDLLLAGIDAAGGPTDVPECVVQAALGSGLLVEADRGVVPGDVRRPWLVGPGSAVPVLAAVGHNLVLETAAGPEAPGAHAEPGRTPLPARPGGWS